MVRLDMHFRAELHWPGKIEIGLGVVKFGRTSVTFDQVVFSEGRCVASAQAVAVLIDEATRKPTPLTGDIKANSSPGFAAAWIDLSELCLAFRRRHHEAIEIVTHLDLARQPRIRPHVEAEIQHVLFHRRRRADLLTPGFIDIDMAGRTRAGPATFGFDTRNGVTVAASITVAPFSTSMVRFSPEWSTKWILAMIARAAGI